MVTGTGRNVPTYVSNSGFSVCESVKILGFEIGRNFDDLQKNFDKKKTVLKKLLTFGRNLTLALLVE
jgi:hypothetical protein